MKKTLPLLLPLFCAVTFYFFNPLHAVAQVLTQQVTGIVVDRETKLPLAGATVSVADSGFTLTAVADSLGRFLLSRVPVGRRNISCSFIGYSNYLSDGIVVNAAKEVEIIIEMEPSPEQTTEEVVVKTSRNPKQPLNRQSVVSTRSFSPEETQRYAASVNDPGRMAMNFPGVQPTRDVRSDIIVRGNNPMGVLWRLEGVDIPNPNHFARKGSSGGGISMLSISMLDNSDFSTGAFAAEYGDAMSAVFDMHLRKGNNQHQEYTLKAGMIGLEFATEGPFKKDGASYLLNYRYSTLGLLNTMGLNLVGERENNTFTDFSFNVVFPGKSQRTSTNLWAVAGYSKETYDPVEDVNDWEQYDDYAVYDFRTKMAAGGLTHKVNLKKGGTWNTTIAYSTQRIDYVDDTLNTSLSPFRVNDEQYDNSRLTLSSNIQWSPVKNFYLKPGVLAQYLFYKMKQDSYDFTSGKYGNVLDGDGNALQLQPYLSAGLKLHPKITLNGGVHFIWLSLNQSYSIEPRLSLQYKVTNQTTLSAATGRHGKVIPLGSYFYKASIASSNLFPNKDLDIMQADHAVFAIDQLLKKNWHLRAELYGQWLRKIPVSPLPANTFWYLNLIEGFANEPLVSKGKGRNWGVDLLAEKFFSKGWFVLSTLSIFKSEFAPGNGKWYNTLWNSGAGATFSGAREFSLKRNRVFQAGWKALYNGGLRITPLKRGVTQDNREPQLDETRPFTEQVPDYFRTDLRFALRKDKAKVSWQLALDIQNVLGIDNTDALARRYDPSTQQWVLQSLSGIVPVLSYQIDF